MPGEIPYSLSGLRDATRCLASTAAPSAPFLRPAQHGARGRLSPRARVYRGRQPCQGRVAGWIDYLSLLLSATESDTESDTGRVRFICRQYRTQ